MRVAIIRATGFVGSALISRLADEVGREVPAIARGAWRHPSSQGTHGCRRRDG